MTTQYDTDYFVHDGDPTETEPSDRKRKHSPSRQMEENTIDLNLGETSESEFEKSDLPDFSEFTVENGTIKLESNLAKCSQDKELTKYPEINPSYDNYLENISLDRPCEGSGDKNESSPGKIAKNVIEVKGFHPLKSHLMSHNSRSFSESLTSAELSNVQSSPVPAHFISATGDSHSGWYEVLEVNENGLLSQAKQSEDSLSNIDTSSIVSQQLLTTPVCSQSFLRNLPSSSFVYTPHPRTGHVLYLTNPNATTPEGIQSKLQTVTPLTVNGTNLVPHFSTTPEEPSQIHPQILFRTGDDENKSPIVTTDTNEISANRSRNNSPKEIKPKESTQLALLDSPEAIDEERETHNMKERKRRARIKEACDLMRQLVPGMSEKTDKATVFEFAARYIYYLKNFVGNAHDKDFLIKYSPY